MASFNVGDWFAYQFTVAVSGRPQGEIAIERFVIKSIDGDKVTLARDLNNGTPETVEGDVSFGTCVFDYGNLAKRGSDNMKTSFGSMYVTVYENESGDDGLRIFIGKDNIAFRIIKTRKTDAGLYTETHELCWSNVKL